MPIKAPANVGIILTDSRGDSLTSPVAVSHALGLDFPSAICQKPGSDRCAISLPPSPFPLPSPDLADEFFCPFLLLSLPLYPIPAKRVATNGFKQTRRALYFCQRPNRKSQLLRATPSACLSSVSLGMFFNRARRPPRCNCSLIVSPRSSFGTNTKDHYRSSDIGQREHSERMFSCGAVPKMRKYVRIEREHCVNFNYPENNF